MPASSACALPRTTVPGSGLGCRRWMSMSACSPPLSMACRRAVAWHWAWTGCFNLPWARRAWPRSWRLRRPIAECQCTQRLAHLNLAAGCKRCGKVDLVGKGENHRGAELEAAHLRAALKVDRLVKTDTLNLAGKRCDLAGPDGFNRGDDHGADQYYRHGALLGIEMTHQALITGEQVGYVVSSGRIDRKQPSRYVDHLGQGAGQWHMHTMIVTGREVDIGVAAARITPCRLGIATQQVDYREAVPLGLQ